MKLTTMIEEAFANVERPDIADYTESRGGEAYEESSEFFDKPWQSLKADYLETYRGVLYWFTPETFLYYLPAFLNAAVETDDTGWLFVDSIIFLLRPTDSEKFSRERWSRLNDKQIAALRAWLEWLLDKAKDDKIITGEIREGIEAIDARLWW